MLAVVVVVLLAAVATFFALRDTRTVDGEAHPGTLASTTAPPSTTAPLPRQLRPGATYVNMGDSYAAGTGGRDLAPDAPVRCQRTASNPGAQVAKRMKWKLTDVSCTSATTENLTVAQNDEVEPQVDALSEKTDVVSVILGANDEAFFGLLVSKCADLGGVHPTGSPCKDQYGDELKAILTDETGPNLTAAFEQIAAAAPNAQIYAVGYPWLVPKSGDCRPALAFADGDIPFARSMQALLNEKLEAAVASVDGTFVDMSGLSDGHDACAGADARWVEPAFDPDTGRRTGVPGNHPNERGQAAMATALEAAIRAQR